MDNRVKEIEDRLAKATPGDWTVIKHSWAVTGIYKGGSKIAQVPHDVEEDVYAEHVLDNSELIAHAPSDLRYLLDRVKALEAGMQSVLINCIRVDGLDMREYSALLRAQDHSVDDANVRWMRAQDLKTEGACVKVDLNGRCECPSNSQARVHPRK